MTNELALRRAELPAPLGAEKLQLLKKVLHIKCSDDMLMFFGEVCHRIGLDPFRKQIYLVMRKDKNGDLAPAIQTGIDGFRAQAARTGEYAGQDLPEHDTENADYPKWSKVTVYRWQHGIRVAYTAMARMREYYQKSNPLWDKMPYAMLDKCAEALAIRKGFPEVAGMELEGQEDNDGPELVAAPANPAAALNERMKIAAPVSGPAPALNADHARLKARAEMRDITQPAPEPQEPPPPIAPPPAAAPPEARTVRQRWDDGVAAFAKLDMSKADLMQHIGMDSEEQLNSEWLRKAGELYSYMTTQPKPSDLPTE